MKRLIIGSRASKLALKQAELVKKRLEAVHKASHTGLNLEIKTIKTTGDKILDAPLSKIGDKGLFVKEIEEALLRKEIDIAVHSMKDLPTDIPTGLNITAITKRLNPCDVLISKKEVNIKSLPQNSIIGTSSLRRQAQLLSLRNDLEIVNLRGNLDTRIKKLQEGSFNAIIVAYAGIKRLEVEVNMSLIDLNDVLPQAGQGALGIETRQNDNKTNDLIKILDDSDSRLCIEAERILLSKLGGGCQVPIGVYANTQNDQIHIKAGVFSLDGKKAIKDEVKGNKTKSLHLAMKLADSLLKEGARKILDKIIEKQIS